MPKKNYSVYLRTAAKKDIKRLHPKLKIKTFDYLKDLESDPFKGERLTGILKGFCSYHFAFVGTEYRIIYAIDEIKKVVVIIMIRPRENVYQELKRRL